MFVCLGLENIHGKGKTLADAWEDLRDNIGMNEEEFDSCTFYELGDEIKVERVIQAVPKTVAVTKSTPRK